MRPGRRRGFRDPCDFYTDGVPFKLGIDYKPRGDQATAIEQLTRGLFDGEKHQVLLGVTGSGKTFTMAKVIEACDRPALVLAHNKTLAAQLYHEFKTFFPVKRSRILRQLLRLLSAGSLHSLGRYLHRKRSHHQRRAGQAAPLRHALAVRAPRLRDRRQRQLHLRPGLARSLLRHAADARKRPAHHPQGDCSSGWSKFSTIATITISAAARFACAAT